MDLKKYQQLKDMVDDAQRRAERAAGAAEQLLARLRAEHGCETVEDGKKLLKRLERKAADAEEQFGEALEDFEAKWGDKLSQK